MAWGDSDTHLIGDPKGETGEQMHYLERLLIKRHNPKTEKNQTKRQILKGGNKDRLPSKE